MKNDKQRFSILLEPEYKRANMFCRKLSGDADRGDDLFGEALLIAFRRFGSLKDEDSFRPWLYRIIVNRFKSETRRPWYRKVGPLSRELELTLEGENPVDRNDAKRWLRQAFETISTEAQALITLYEIEGWSVGELAELHHRSESWVKVNLHRARKKLRERLEQDMNRKA